MFAEAKSSRARLLYVPVVLLASTLCLAAHAAESANDPWGRVPPLAVGAQRDKAWEDKVAKLAQAMDAEIAQQKATNTKILAAFNSMDPGEKAQRMQAYMMKNPQEAMKMVQDMQAAGTTVMANQSGDDAETAKLDQELESLHDRYTKEVQSSAAQYNAKQDAMNAKFNEKHAMSAADKEQFSAIDTERQAAGEKIYLTYVAPGGPVMGWLARYNTALNDHAASVETTDSMQVNQLAIMDSPSGGYRSTAKLEAARAYLGKLQDIYNWR
jgi:hypothetical protein